jgi:hypothetical protein
MAGSGSITVPVVAVDNSTTGGKSITCTDNGGPLAVNGICDTNTARLSGSVGVASDGTHSIARTAADRWCSTATARQSSSSCATLRGSGSLPPASEATLSDGRHTANRVYDGCVTFLRADT